MRPAHVPQVSPDAIWQYSAKRRQSPRVNPLRCRFTPPSSTGPMLSGDIAWSVTLDNARNFVAHIEVAHIENEP